MTSTTDPTEDRDQRGRFRPGWRGGPGNPKLRHLAELQGVVHATVEPRLLEGVIKRLLRMAIEGDVAAARLLLDRVLGRAAESAVPRSFRMPRVKSVGDLPGALNRIMQAAAKGEIGTDDALRFASMLDMTGRALAVAEVEERLQRLETGAGLGPRRLA